MDLAFLPLKICKIHKPSSGTLPNARPSCNNSAALAATVIGEGQQSTSVSPNMFSLDPD